MQLHDKISEENLYACECPDSNTHRPEVKERAAKVLNALGITVSDAVRILLTRTANEGVPFALGNAVDHDARFRVKVQKALDASRPGIAHDKVESHFAQRRSAVLHKTK